MSKAHTSLKRKSNAEGFKLDSVCYKWFLYSMYSMPIVICGDICSQEAQVQPAQVSRRVLLNEELCSVFKVRLLQHDFYFW